MSRKRFEDIKKFIHYADNDSFTAGDKLAKIRPLQDQVNASLQQFGLFEKDAYLFTNNGAIFWQALRKDVYSGQADKIWIRKLGSSFK